MLVISSLINAGPKFYVEIVDFNLGPADVFVVTKLVTVATFQFPCVFSSFVFTMSPYCCLTISLDDFCEKVSDCHDICAALCIFSFCCELATTFLTYILLSVYRDKCNECRDKVGLTSIHNCCDIDSFVETNIGDLCF